MKTVSYILRIEPDQGRNRPSGRDKVVDLAAWRAEHLMEPDHPETDDLPVSVPERRGYREPVRRGRRTALDRAELAATLAVIVAFLALAARVLL